MPRPASSLIATYSGSLVDPLNLSPSDIQLGDVAHALAHLCRFTGHVRRFYSVAEHSYRVSFMVPPEDALWGLLHDATEAYLCDVSRPVKQQPALAGYRDAEDRVMRAVCQKFGLPPTMPSSVAWADRESCMQEGWLLVPGWPGRPTMETFPVIRGLAPMAAKKAFLDRFSELTALAR